MPTPRRFVTAFTAAALTIGVAIPAHADILVAKDNHDALCTIYYTGEDKAATVYSTITSMASAQNPAALALMNNRFIAEETQPSTYQHNLIDLYLKGFKGIIKWDDATRHKRNQLSTDYAKDIARQLGLEDLAPDKLDLLAQELRYDTTILVLTSPEYGIGASLIEDMATDRVTYSTDDLDAKTSSSLIPAFAPVPLHYNAPASITTKYNDPARMTFPSRELANVDKAQIDDALERAIGNSRDDDILARLMTSSKMKKRLTKSRRDFAAAAKQAADAAANITDAQLARSNSGNEKAIQACYDFLYTKKKNARTSPEFFKVSATPPSNAEKFVTWTSSSSRSSWRQSFAWISKQLSDVSWLSVLGWIIAIALGAALFVVNRRLRKNASPTTDTAVASSSSTPETTSSTPSTPTPEPVPLSPGSPGLPPQPPRVSPPSPPVIPPQPPTVMPPVPGATDTNVWDDNAADSPTSPPVLPPLPPTGPHQQ